LHRASGIGEFRPRAKHGCDSVSDATLNVEYGRPITLLVTAAYMSHEKRRVTDLTDPAVLAELEDCVPLIQQGKGNEVL
jgi:hypothetical protein